MRARFVVALAVLAALLAVPVAHAARPGASGWVLTRTGRGPAVLRARLHAEARGRDASVVLFALKGRGAARTLENAFSTTTIAWGGDTWVDVYGDPVATPRCVDVACDDLARTPFDYTFHTNGHRSAATVYVAAWAADTTVTLETPGWRVRPWRPTIRFVGAEDGGGQGVRVDHTHAGTFREASAPGGRWGSVAHAVVPCETHGSGSARFTGGRRHWTLECGGQHGWLEETPRATRWRLHGETEGISGSGHVLLVVDYPKG